MITCGVTILREKMFEYLNYSVLAVQRAGKPDRVRKHLQGRKLKFFEFLWDGLWTLNSLVLNHIVIIDLHKLDFLLKSNQ